MRGAGWNYAMVVGAALSVFSFVAVNYWIYTARWWFNDLRPDWAEPPTISRAISVEAISVPFSVWVTAAGFALTLTVGLLGAYYLRLTRHLSAPRLFLRGMLYAGVPLAVVLQAVSGWGMNALSVNRLGVARDMHMLGSYAFFGAQAAVILIYALINHAFMRDRASLDRAAVVGRLDPIWVRRRRNVSFAVVGLTVIYGALFQLKSIYPYDVAPWLFVAYVNAELAVITCFLVVVVLAHADKLRDR